jgi:hypothetical protein
MGLGHQFYVILFVFVKTYRLLFVRDLWQISNICNAVDQQTSDNDRAQYNSKAGLINCQKHAQRIK